MGFYERQHKYFSIPNTKKYRVVNSFDGFLSYLLIKDEVLQMVWVFLCKLKELPVEYASEFLHVYGLKEGKIIRFNQRGELSYIAILTRNQHKVKPTGANGASQNGSIDER